MTSTAGPDLPAIRERATAYASVRGDISSGGVIVAELLGAARRSADDVPALLAAIDEVRALHTDSVAGPCPVCYRSADVSDTDDGLVDWPCPTIRALDATAEALPIPGRAGAGVAS